MKPDTLQHFKSFSVSYNEGKGRREEVEREQVAMRVSFLKLITVKNSVCIFSDRPTGTYITHK
jgi:hypothetical protein